MESQDVTSRTAVRVEAEHIGGIEHAEHSFEPGVTLLTGRNATNRTSLIQAIMAGFGSDNVSLKGDCDRGSVTLEIDGEEYTRTLSRQGDSVALDGDPYLNDPEAADLFAFLLESNAARRAVERDDDLRDILMEPVDASAIQAEIRQYKSERDDIDERIDTLEARKTKLPSLRQQLTDLDEEIETKGSNLEEAREQLAELSADADEARAEESELERKMDALQEKRSELNTIEFRLDSERESLESLRTQREELESEYADLSDEDLADVSAIESEIDQLRRRKQNLEDELGKLQTVIQFNEEMMDGTSSDIVAALRDDDSEGAITDELLDDRSQMVCWTCGTEVDSERIEDTLDRLRNLRQSKYGDQRDIDDRLAELKDRKTSVEATANRREAVERDLADVRAEIDQREAKIDELEERTVEITEAIETREGEIEDLESRDQSAVLEAQETVNRLELELERLENDRQSVAADIEDIEDAIEDIEQLQDQREQVVDQLEELRGRIDRIEQRAVQEFNDHMDAILDILEYNNLERIWVERIESAGSGRGRGSPSREFRLHIVRSTDDGVTYEDDFDHLSESEREVTGLIFALAGYLAHDVYEEVPVILLDSLEAIDSSRIATLMEYLQEYADYLVVALLHEDARALDDDYTRITEI